MKKSPLSRSIIAPGSWEDATNEWKEGIVVVDDEDSAAGIRIAEQRAESVRPLVPQGVAALVHPSAPTASHPSPPPPAAATASAAAGAAARTSPRHRGGAAPSFSLAKTLATKALANAHRRGAALVDKDTGTMAGEGEDPSYVVVANQGQHQQRHPTAPYAETVTDGVLSPGRIEMPAIAAAVTMQESTQQWVQSPSTAHQQTPMRMPEPILPLNSPVKQPPTTILAMPEPTIPSTVQQSAPIPMPEPPAIVRESPRLPQSMKMPEPHIGPAPVSMPLPAVPQVGGMSMPEPSIPILSPPPEMSIPQLPSTAVYPDQTSIYANSHPAPSRGAGVGGALVPDSTYDPASLQPPQWTDTRTPATAFAEVGGDEDALLGRIRSALQHLPPSVRATLPKEELIRVVLEAIEGGPEKDRVLQQEQQPIQQAYVQDSAAAWPPYPYQYQYDAYGAPVQQVWPAVEYAPVMQDTASLSANDWYRMNGGGLLPAGWTAHFDHTAGQWYYSNMSVLPPVTTWHDPRLTVQMPVPVSVPIPASMLPPAPLPPSTYTYPTPQLPSRQEADYLACRFGALEAHRQYRQNAPGPVSAELSLERKQSEEIQDAIQATQKAHKEANEAIAQGRPDDFQAAQEAMVKARGKLDRIKYEAQLKTAALTSSSSLNGLPVPVLYQGPTRGFDVDPAYVRPRTTYTDAWIIPPPPPPPPVTAPMHYPLQVDPVTTTSSFSGRVMGKFFKQRLPNNLYMPTAYPLPPGVKYKASTTTPTPYSIPEFCFAWDMLLRSRRTPNTAIPAPYPY